MVESPNKTQNTIFDRILRKEIPAELVYDDEHVTAFRDINAQAPVHVLVIPKARVERFVQLKDQDPEVVGAFFVGVARVADKLGLARDGFRIVINNGTHGQQTVEYLHAHILGGRQMNWPPG